MAMSCLSMLLILTAFLSSSTAYKEVLMDSSNCVHLRCEWRGLGKHCKPFTSSNQPNQQKTVSDAIPLNYEFRSDDESEATIFARIKTRYPVNTFTVVNDIGVGEQCQGRRLWCNLAKSILIDDDNVSLKRPSRVFTTRPKLRC